MKHTIYLIAFYHFSFAVAAQWQLSSTGNNAGVTHCFIESSGVLLAGGNVEGIYASTDMGSTWSPSNTGIPAGSEILCFGKNSAGIFAGSDNAIYFSGNNGSSWSLIKLTYPTFAFAFLSDTVFAATMGEGIIMSDNNGTTWTSANSGITTLNVYSIIRKGNLLFAGTAGDGVFISSNSGTSWSTANSNLPSSVVIRCLETDGINLYAGTVASFNPFIPQYGMFISPNNGTSWTLVFNGITINSYVFGIKSIGNDLFAASGEIYRSLDNGLTWTVFMNGIDTTCAYGAAGFLETSSYVFAGFEGGCIGSVFRIDKSTLTSNNELQFTLSEFQIYPNPASGSVTVMAEGGDEIRILDVAGREIKRMKNFKSSLSFSIDEIENGIYFISLYKNNSITNVQKLIKTE